MPGSLFAQQLQIFDFVMFSGNGGAGTTNPGSSGYGVIFGSSTTITNGAIGSYALVKTTGNSNISANIFSGGKVILANGSTVSGRITAANSAGLSGTILQVGSNANLSGVIDVNGNITVGGGTVSGPVTTSGTYLGPTPTNGIIYGTPSLPTMPALPAITGFPAVGSSNITTTQSIAPGSYNNITLNGNKTLTFNGPGIYVFNSINLNGNNNFVYDFKNLSSGVFRIYIYGDANLAKLGTSIINGGSASRIYLETHGTGSSSSSGKDALSISNGSNGGNGAVKFFGTVWAPYAAVSIGSGTGSSEITGALYSATQVVIQTGVTFNYAPFSDCTPPVADAGADKSFCAGGSAQLGSAPVSGNTYSWSPTTGLSSSTVSNPTVSLSTEGTTTYTVAVTSGTCISTDQVVVTVNALPAANAGSNVSLCAGGSVLIGSVPVSGNTYSWSPATGLSSSTVSNPTVSSSTPGTTTYTLTVTKTATGCSKTSSVNVTVNSLPDVNAGLDGQLDCSTPTTILTGSSSVPNAQFSWLASNGGGISANANTATPTVNFFGTFTLIVTNPATGCSASDTAVVTFDPCIFAGYPPPDDGKSDDIIGSELTSLFENYDGTTNPNPDIFIISDDEVMVEIIYTEGMYSDLYNILISAPFNATIFIDNGTGNRIITTIIDIEDLDDLNNLNITTGTDLINYVRPVYPAIPTAGVANTLGDVAQKSDLARNGFKVDGEGIKVGVLSNSYNTLPGNPAQTDVVNGDLPGTGNPDGDTIPIQVLQDYPYSIQSDEGRAMLQIVHDVAPKASLAFNTGFISAGNMAQAIRQLQQIGCNVEVDDLTYITEPFFRDGMIAQAVDDVTALGVSYFTSAGNYGDKSYEGIYTPMAAPGNIVGTAHDFGGGDRFQNISLTPGSYLLALQWEDDFYSIDSLPIGTDNDLDIYLTYDNGITLFGCNRNNIGGDPIEILPFTVTLNTTTNILVTRETGTGTNVHFKYVVFKIPEGGFVINEFNQGNSTIVGQANSTGAITTGAVLYSNTPPFGVSPPTKASFSSIGGTLTYGFPRNKPDICAPNGGNTTVQLGGPNIDNDAFPNFFGTSAAAPHAAAIGALLSQAKQKYYGAALSSNEMRNLLTGTASNMYDPGFDYLSGYGLVDADSAMRTFAAPTPNLISLDVPSGVTPGDSAFTLTVTADYLTTQSKIVFRDDTLQTTWIDDHHLSAVIPSFFGNPPIQVCSPAITPSAEDGGCSNVLYFFTPVQINVVIVADNKTKLYGEKLPELTATITVDGQPLTSSGYTLADLGLDDLSFITPATSTSNVGIYYIQANADVSDVGLQELYDYTFTNGLLFINKMPLVITPADTTVLFGDKIDGSKLSFTYSYDTSNIAPGEQTDFLDSLRNIYEPLLVKEVALIDDRAIFDGNSLSDADLMNLAFLSGSKGIANGSRGVVNGSRAVANNLPFPDTTYVVDLSYESLVNYNVDDSEATLTNDILLINGSHAVANGSRGVVNCEALVDGSALINGSHAVANGSHAVANGSSESVGSNILDDSSNSNTAVIIHEEDLNTEENPDSVFRLYSINAITGLTAGVHWIVPGGFLSSNFEVTYGLGHLTILPYELNVDADDKSVEYGTAPAYTSIISGYQYDDSASVVFSGSIGYTPASNSQINVGTHTIVPGNLTLIQPANYYLNYVSGTLEVSPATLTATADNKTRAYGFTNPPLTISYSGFKFSDNANVINPAISIATSATVSSPWGTYPINLSGGSASNYNLVLIPGTLTIDPPPACTINAPASIPTCSSTGNILTADAPGGYTYTWSVTGTGWQITNGNGTPSVTYTAGGSGTTGTFTLSLYAPQSSILVSTCTLNLEVVCSEYCTYLQNFWSNTNATDCNGITSSTILPGLLSTELTNGDANRKIIIGTTEASCLQSRLPSGNSSTQLPNGIVYCNTATGNSYLNNGKFRSNLLGQEISLALSVRLSPALAALRITGPYITTYAATTCVNGSAVAGTKQVFAIPQSVVTYLGANNTVADLISLANKGLGGTLSNGAPSLVQIANACLAITSAFDHCRILAGFSQNSGGVRVENADASSVEINNLQIYPNPASENATVSFLATKESHATLDVYGMNGSLMTHVLDGNVSEDGIYSVDVDCSSFAKGIYLVRLVVGEETLFGKLVIVK